MHLVNGELVLVVVWRRVTSFSLLAVTSDLENKHDFAGIV
jgi:hypothetical protein